MKKNHLSTSFGILTIAILFIWFFYRPEVTETIIFFPINEAVVYNSVNTTLTMQEGKEAREYIINWRIGSSLGQRAYLRQDAGFLYKNGRLIGKLGDWKQNSDKISQGSQFTGNDTAKFEAVTFHHAELHDSGDQISSAQNMSSDLLYAVNSQYSPMRSFRIPNNKEDDEWKNLLEEMINKQLEQSLSDAKKEFHLNRENFYTIWLTELPQYKDKPLPGFSVAETNEIIGKLWEGLYKNYFHGIKKQDGTTITPLGSTIPILMFAKDKSILYVLTESANGEAIILVQQIPDK